MRQAKVYSPEQRRYLEENLFCTYCGNTTAFQIDLKLKHLIGNDHGSVSISLLKSYSEKVMGIVQRNIDYFLEQAWEDKPMIKCANCHQGESLDLQGRAYDYCYYNGCPGCFVCGAWIPEEELRDLCGQCIRDKEGAITEDDCMYNCPWTDAGMLEVMDHYHVTLKDLIESQGY